ncbi:MAG: LysR family transcriptional regulator [Salaquimonas sp.]
MSISLLKTLIAISECGSFSGAADRICISQAAVGQQMKRLEEQLSVALFDRSRKIPRLNSVGKSMVPKARQVVNAYEAMVSEVSGDAQMVGELTLGAVPSAIRGLIPLSIKKLIKNYPDLHIRVVPGLSGDLLEQVERGAIDAAVLSAPGDVGLSLQWQPFVDEELVLLVSPEVEENDPMKLLQELPFIRHTRRAAVGILSDDWLAKNKIVVRPSMEMESLETLCSMVAHNLGISIVPNLCVQDPIFASLKKLPLAGHSAPRTLGVLTRSDCSKLLVVDMLLKELELTVEEHRMAVEN